jgi:hypothetical protein
MDERKISLAVKFRYVSENIYSVFSNLEPEYFVSKDESTTSFKVMPFPFFS